MSLVDRSLLDLFVYARNSGAMRTNKDGVQEVVPANTPRLDYDPVTRKPLGLLFESSSTNYIRNPTMQGAVVGVLGSGGALPTNWTIYGNTQQTLTKTIVGVGVEDGIDYVDIQFKGKTADVPNTEAYVIFDSPVAAAAGQSWSASAYVKVVGGSLTNLYPSEIYIVCYDAVTLSEAGAKTFNFPTAGGLKENRVSYTRTLSAATTARIHSRLDLNVVRNADIDITLRIGVPQLEPVLAPTSLIKSNGAATARGGDYAALKPDLFPALINKKEGTFVIRFAIDSLIAMNTTYNYGYLLMLRCADGKCLNIHVKEFPTVSTICAEYSTVKKIDLITRTWPGRSMPLNAKYKQKKNDFVTVAVSYKDGAVGLAHGGSVSTYTYDDAVFPDFNSFEIGGFGFNGRIQDVKYIPRVLPEPMLLNASLGLI